MSDCHHLASNITFNCDFGAVRLDIPFVQQQSLQRFLDVPTSEEGRPLSDKLLQRFLAIAECITTQELNKLTSKLVLKELNLGYQLWRTLLPNEDDTIKTEDLIESGWVNQNEVGIEAPSFETSSFALPHQLVEQLMERCQEEARYRLAPELLAGKSLYIFIYGFTISPQFENLSPQTFGRSRCGCGGRRVYPDVNGCSQNRC